jgi:hypothetical protein
VVRRRPLFYFLEFVMEPVARTESAGNYWEKYGIVCFDTKQKAVLTTCTLRNQTTGKDIPCAFSFTIRRDTFSLPNAIIGNWLPTVRLPGAMPLGWELNETAQLAPPGRTAVTAATTSAGLDGTTA